jgi:tRNA G18 (ribose-2'-O)-methylase SpoU
MPVKRSAAKEASNHPRKKSKTGEDEERNVALSKEALANHEKFLEELAKKEEMSEKDFSQALAKLPEKQVQLLWKSSRLAGNLLTKTRSTRKRPMGLAVWPRRNLCCSAGPWMVPSVISTARVQ